MEWRGNSGCNFWQVEIARLPVVARLGDDSVAKGLLTTAKLRCYAQKLGQKNAKSWEKPDLIAEVRATTLLCPSPTDGSGRSGGA